MDYNPPNNFGAILLATFRQGVQNHQTGITAIAPLYVDICPPIISVEKKQSQREKYQLKSFTFSFLLPNMKEKRSIFLVIVIVMVIVKLKGSEKYKRVKKNCCQRVIWKLLEGS